MPSPCFSVHGSGWRQSEFLKMILVTPSRHSGRAMSAPCCAGSVQIQRVIGAMMAARRRRRVAATFLHCHLATRSRIWKRVWVLTARTGVGAHCTMPMAPTGRLRRSARLTSFSMSPCLRQAVRIQPQSWQIFLYRRKQSVSRGPRYELSRPVRSRRSQPVDLYPDHGPIGKCILSQLS